MKHIAEGAEARIYKVEEGILKQRVAKGYRHPWLDEKLRSQRTSREVRVLERLSEAGIPAPRLVSRDKTDIIMEHLDGKKLRDEIDKDVSGFARQVGEGLAKLHASGIIHGDLTTSNMIVRAGVVHFIDFGLSQIADKVEHKAVDLHVLRESLEAHHPEHVDDFFKDVLDSYLREAEDGDAVLERFEVVEKRGRNKGKGN